MIVREAVPEDADEACAILRRSITELCHADHGGDAANLEPWLANKTPGNVRAWINAPQASVFVASDGKALLGVSAITDSGHVTLNYVAPEARFRGVSRLLLRRLEDRARELGIATCRLKSTETAHKFYLSAGYRDAAPPEQGPGRVRCYPMSKPL